MSQQGQEDAGNLLDGLDIDIPAPVAAAGSAAAAAAGQPADFFGPYQLIQKVGQGGVARVMRARHMHPRYADTTFAIKILHEELSRDPKVVELFRHEAYVLSLLKHPNVVQTFEAGAQDDKLFIAMEYIDGRDLENLMLRCQRGKVMLPLQLLMHISSEVLKGLAYAHELADGDGQSLHLVHRDVNPVNVFLSYDGRVKLGDFGVASIAAVVEKSRELAGKAGYFAPEQLEGGKVDQRADLFAVGVMLFEMLTGTRLFEADSADKMMRLNKRAKIPKPSSLNPSITSELESVMLKALERKPEDRFQSAREMLSALGRFIPAPVGMPLALAALMRKIFLPEHIQELQLREGLSGSAMSRGAGQLVAVFSADERAQAAFNELLLSRGYRAEVCGTLERLAEIIGSPQAPAAVLADVGSKGFAPAGCIAALKRSGRPLPVVAVSEGLEPQWIHLADAIGAVDLLFKPFNIERVLTAVRAAVSGAARIASVQSESAPAVVRVHQRVLVLSRDPALIARVSSGLSEHGFDIEVSPTVVEALERTDHMSFHAVVYDAHPASPADRLFAAQLRGRPAMGLIPILYLSTPESQRLFAGVDADRGLAKLRSDGASVLIDALTHLIADNRLGRIFLRYPADFAAELRYGGRVFSGKAMDISRGGFMVRCSGMPPVGSEVGVSLRLPTAPEPVEVAGRVVRVNLPSGGETHAAIGVEFERFAGKDESALIAYLVRLDPGTERRQTLILKQPPR